MTTAEITTLLNKAATSDMNRAKKYGDHMVAQTKAGLVTIIFDGTDYELRAQFVGQVAQGRAEVKKALIGLYQVVEA